MHVSGMILYKFVLRGCIFLSLITALPLFAAEKPTQLKNLILLIGDGMGPQQIGLLQTYAKLAPNSIYKGRLTAIESLFNHGQTGLSLTHPEDKIVVDSACSATQLATGHISGSEMIGLDAQGRAVRTILEQAKSQGRKVGLVSDTRITHATPAAFAAHQPHRSLETEIAAQMLQQNMDVLLSGGISYWLPVSVNDDEKLQQHYAQLTGGHIKIKSKRTDDQDLLAEAMAMGYSTVFDKHSLATAKDKVLGLFAYAGMSDGIRNSQEKHHPQRQEPTLAEMTHKALDLLAESESGFFLMVEGGQIDWAGHGNDASALLHEMIKFDEAVQVVYDWSRDREDTVVVLTADHETGGFGFSYNRFNVPQGKALATEAFKNRLFQPNFNFCDRTVLDKIYQQKASFYNIIKTFDALPEAQQTPLDLARLLEEKTGFPITSAEAAKVLATEPNHHRVPGHKYLDAAVFPKVDDFESFYVYGKDIRGDLIGRVLAKHQCTVWATGTHTATPVTVTAMGIQTLADQVKGITSHAELGEMMMFWLDNY